MMISKIVSGGWTGTGLCLTHELRWERVGVWGKARKRLVDWGYLRPETRVFNYWDEDVAFPVSVSGGRNAALAMCRKGVEEVFLR